MLVLTGCSSPSVGGGTSGDGQSGSGSSPSDGTDSSDTTGGLEGYQGLPSTFPTDVPIVDGDVPVGLDLGTGWSIIVKVDDIDSAYQDAKQKLIAKGFTAEVDNTTADGSVGVFLNDKYQINVTASQSKDYGPNVNYVVVIKG